MQTRKSRIPSSACQTAPQPEQLRRQRTPGNSASGFAWLGAPSRDCECILAPTETTLENREAIDVRAALAFLRARPDVDRRDVALVGDSFGSSLTLVVGEHEPALRAVVVFATAGYSWERSPELRARLLASVERLTAPVFFIHAANDYTTSSGETLAARSSELGRPHRLTVYPPIGRTSEEGHGFLYSGVSIWENDVFAFLDQHMRR